MKKNHNYSFLCYFGLIILTFLLFLPPALRIFGKDLYVKEEKKKDEIIILNCKKENESINSTFLNGEPKNLEYLIKGNYTVTTNEEEESETSEKDKEDNQNTLLVYIKPYSQVKYDEEKDITSYNVKTIDLKQINNYPETFSTVDNQQNYFTKLNFSCTRANY